MKIKPEDIKILESLRDTFIAKNNKSLNELYMLALPIMQEDRMKIKDIGVYTRWTLARYAGIHSARVNNGNSLINELYTYLNDEHINTALKKVWGI